MDWDQIERNWKQAKATIKRKWEKLTDEDLEFHQGATQSNSKIAAPAAGCRWAHRGWQVVTRERRGVAASPR